MTETCLLDYPLCLIDFFVFSILIIRDFNCLVEISIQKPVQKQISAKSEGKK